MPNQRLLVFSAHTADFCSRCGGTLATHTRRGDMVRVIDVTFGERGESGGIWRARPETPLAEAKVIRRREAEAAATILGVEIDFYDWDDYPLFIGPDRFPRLVQEIRSFRPSMVLTH